MYLHFVGGCCPWCIITILLRGWSSRMGSRMFRTSLLYEPARRFSRHWIFYLTKRAGAGTWWAWVSSKCHSTQRNCTIKLANNRFGPHGERSTHCLPFGTAISLGGSSYHSRGKRNFRARIWVLALSFFARLLALCRFTQTRERHARLRISGPHNSDLGGVGFGPVDVNLIWAGRLIELRRCRALLTNFSFFFTPLSLSLIHYTDNHVNW